MTGNVAQAIVAPEDWDATLAGAHAALRSGGHLVFETRVPARREWEEWTRAASHEIPGVGKVESWDEVMDVSGPLVTFRWTGVFASDGATLTSDSTLRFRERAEVEADLEQPRLQRRRRPRRAGPSRARDGVHRATRRVTASGGAPQPSRPGGV